MVILLLTHLLIYVVFPVGCGVTGDNTPSSSCGDFRVRHRDSVADS